LRIEVGIHKTVHAASFGKIPGQMLFFLTRSGR
jgi:hypothetical protein